MRYKKSGIHHFIHTVKYSTSIFQYGHFNNLLLDFIRDNHLHYWLVKKREKLTIVNIKRHAAR